MDAVAECPRGSGFDRGARGGTMARPTARVVRVARSGRSAGARPAHSWVVGRGVDARRSDRGADDRLSLDARGAGVCHEYRLRGRSAVRRADRALGRRSPRAPFMVRRTPDPGSTRSLVAGRARRGGGGSHRSRYLPLETRLFTGCLAAADPVSRRVWTRVRHLRALRPCRRDRLADGGPDWLAGSRSRRVLARRSCRRRRVHGQCRLWSGGHVLLEGAH